jgi:hypothetical protein
MRPSLADGKPHLASPTVCDFAPQLWDFNDTIPSGPRVTSVQQHALGPTERKKTEMRRFEGFAIPKRQHGLRDWKQGKPEVGTVVLWPLAA